MREAMAERKEHDVEFLEYVVKSIVDHPDDVKISRTIDEMGVLITLGVNPEDMGQIIGRQGATAKSIRTLLRVIGARNNARVNLKILEPEGSGRGPQGPSRSEKPAGESAPEPRAPRSGADGRRTKKAASTESTEAKEEAVDEAIEDLNI